MSMHFAGCTAYPLVAAIKAVTDVALDSADIEAAALAALTGNGIIVGTGTFTTSSATAPIDTSQAALATDWCRKHAIVPLAGVCAGEVKPASRFTTGTGQYAIGNGGFSQAPGLVAYAILSTTLPLYEAVRLNAGVQSTADLESGTSNKTEAAEAAAVDYNVSITPAAQNTDYPRTSYNNVGVEVEVTIDSHTGAGSIHFSIRKHVAGDLTDPVLVDDCSVAISDAASLRAVINVSVATATAAGSLALGSATSYDVRVWCDGGATATISLIKAHLAVGVKAGSGSSPFGGASDTPTTITHYGNALLPVASTTRVVGSPGGITSSQKLCLLAGTNMFTAAGELGASFSGNVPVPVVLTGTHSLSAYTSDATALSYWNDGVIILEC